MSFHFILKVKEIKAIYANKIAFIAAQDSSVPMYAVNLNNVFTCTKSATINNFRLSAINFNYMDTKYSTISEFDKPS